MKRAHLKKAVRLARMIQLFEHGGAYGSRDFGRMFKVSSNAILRDLQDLQSEPFYLPLVQGEDWRYRLMRP